MDSELNTFLLGKNSLGTLNPFTLWKSIKLGRKILEFIGEIPEWMNYNNHLEQKLQNLTRKMECLGSVKSDVNMQLRATELKSGRKRKQEVEYWLANVKKKAVDVKKIEDNANSVSYLPRFLFRGWLMSCIEQQIQEVKTLHEQGKFPGGLLLNAPQNHWEPLVTRRLVGEVAGKKLDEIWAHMINPRISWIGVQGLEGIGKSVLMAQVYNRLCFYCPVYYVHFPRRFTLYRLQALVAAEMNLKLPLNQGSEVRSASRIFRMLNSMRDFVLFLDGVSRDFCFEDLGIPFEGNGMKVVLASRSMDICRRMSC